MHSGDAGRVGRTLEKFVDTLVEETAIVEASPLPFSTSEISKLFFPSSSMIPPSFLCFIRLGRSMMTATITIIATRTKMPPAVMAATMFAPSGPILEVEDDIVMERYGSVRAREGR